MKRIRVDTGKIGLMYCGNNYQRVLTEGAYWLWPSEDIRIYDMTQIFFAGNR